MKQIMNEKAAIQEEIQAEQASRNSHADRLIEKWSKKKGLDLEAEGDAEDEKEDDKEDKMEEEDEGDKDSDEDSDKEDDKKEESKKRK